MILSALALALIGTSSRDAPPSKRALALPAGYYEFAALARTLSTPEAPVTAAKALRRRVVYLDLRRTDSERLLGILRATSDVVLARDGTTGNRFRLESDPAVLRREARDREAVVARLRDEAERVRLGSEALRREGATSEEVLRRTASTLKVLQERSRTGIDASTADALAETETERFASFTLFDLVTAENRVARLHAAETLPTVTGASFAEPPRVGTWSPARVALAARSLNETPGDGARLTAYDGLRTFWTLLRAPGRISIVPSSRWLSSGPDVNLASVSTSGHLPGDAQQTPRAGLVEALYVGVPGSRRWKPVLGAESRARYAALERETGAFLASDSGRSLAATFAVESRKPFAKRAFSDALRLWSRETGGEIAFELTLPADTPAPFESERPLPGFSAWRLATVEGATVATNLVDFIDRAIPIETPALVALISNGARLSPGLTEEELRTFYASAGATPFFGPSFPYEYYGLTLGTLKYGGAAFLAYEAVRARPAVRDLLERGGTVEISVASLDARSFAAVTGALGADPLFAPSPTQNAREVVRRSSFSVTMRPGAEGRKITVDLRPDRAAVAEYGIFMGLASRVEFLQTRL